MRSTALTTAALCAAALALTSAGPATAAGSAVAAPSSRVTVSGSTATATSTFTASPATTASLAGTCLRDARGGDLDFAPRADVRLTSTPATVTASQTLAAGTYSAWPCALVDGRWLDLAARQTVVVGGSSASPTPTPTPTPAPAGGSPSGQPMPTTAPAGWTTVLADDFTTPVATGSFPGPAYAGRWTGYSGFRDTSGVGSYTPSRVVSVGGGALDLFLHTEGGTPLVAAPVPLPDGGRWGGWTYGRYAIRYRADAVPGYKTAWMLWPDSDVWGDGEIDFPEGDLDGTAHAFVHQPGDPSRNALAVDTGATYPGWHTAVIEWLPSGVTFSLDGRQVGRTSVSPSRPLHLVLQTETSGRPSSSASGHVQVDWITMQRRA